MQGLAHGVREDQPVVVPLDAEQEPLLALPGQLAPERVHRDVDEQDLPARGSRLELLDEVQRASGEVDVGPPEPEQLPFAHPGGEGEDVEGFQPVALDHVQEVSRLVGGEGDEVMAGLARWRDQFGGVAGDKVPAHRVP
jgi:hypothetical protein